MLLLSLRALLLAIVLLLAWTVSHSSSLAANPVTPKPAATIRWLDSSSACTVQLSAPFVDGKWAAQVDLAVVAHGSLRTGDVAAVSSLNPSMGATTGTSPITSAGLGSAPNTTSANSG